VVVKSDHAHGADVDAILRAHGAVDPAERDRFYRESGWSGFDPNAPPLTAEQVRLQRSGGSDAAALDQSII